LYNKYSVHIMLISTSRHVRMLISMCCVFIVQLLHDPLSVKSATNRSIVELGFNRHRSWDIVMPVESKLHCRQPTAVCLSKTGKWKDILSDGGRFAATRRAFTFLSTSINPYFRFASVVVEELYYPTPLIDFFRRSLYIAFP